jgi:uncharacterized membrane protein YedE/YeeE
MHGLLHDRPAWYLVGVVFGLTVVGVYATLNQQVGILGGFSTIVERATGRTTVLGWKAWFVAGVALGGLLYAALSGSWGATDGYGWVTRTFAGPWTWLAGAVLVGAGALIGFGAKLAGGCTSGNGLTGCSFGTRSSLVATVTFFATAVGVTFVIRALGGS